MDALAGNVFALVGAGVWALSSLLFARSRAAPFAMNFGKNVIAAAAFTVTLGAIAMSQRRALLTADLGAVGLLVASAFFGLVAGDTFHFRALREVGPRRALVLETLAPVFAAALGWVVAGERLGAREIGGIAVTLAGVVLVISERRASESRDGSNALGALYGTLAALGQAGGAMLSKLAIARIESAGAGHAALEASLLRLWTAVLFGLAAFAGSRARREDVRAVFALGELRFIGPAALLATYAGVWLSLLAYQHSSVAVASTLLALSPVLVLPLARWFAHERLTVRAVLGALISVAGVALLFWRAE